MNDKLALEILQTIKRGQSFGRTTVRDEILNMEGFHDITQTDVKEEFDRVENLQFILSYHNDAQNGRLCYKLNPEKDGIKILSDKIAKSQNKEDLQTENDRLTTENIRLTNKHLKGKYKWAFWAAIGGYILGHAGKILLYVKHLFR